MVFMRDEKGAAIVHAKNDEGGTGARRPLLAASKDDSLKITARNGGVRVMGNVQWSVVRHQRTIGGDPSLCARPRVVNVGEANSSEAHGTWGSMRIFKPGTTHSRVM